MKKLLFFLLSFYAVQFSYAQEYKFLERKWTIVRLETGDAFDRKEISQITANMRENLSYEVVKHDSYINLWQTPGSKTKNTVTFGMYSLFADEIVPIKTTYELDKKAQTITFLPTTYRSTSGENDKVFEKAVFKIERLTEKEMLLVDTETNFKYFLMLKDW